MTINCVENPINEENSTNNKNPTNDDTPTNDPLTFKTGLWNMIIIKYK